MHTGEQRRIQDVVGGAVDDHIFVFAVRIGLLGGDKRRADIGQIGAHSLGGQYRPASCNRPRQQQRPVEPLANFTDQRQRR